MSNIEDKTETVSIKRSTLNNGKIFLNGGYEIKVEINAVSESVKIFNLVSILTELYRTSLLREVPSIMEIFHQWWVSNYQIFHAESESVKCSAVASILSEFLLMSTLNNGNFWSLQPCTLFIWPTNWYHAKTLILLKCIPALIKCYAMDLTELIHLHLRMGKIWWTVNWLDRRTSAWNYAKLCREATLLPREMH